MEEVKTINSIVKNQLCVRCGGCFAICPSDSTISFDSSFYPRVNYEGCIDCGLCLKVCPGSDVDIPALSKEFLGPEAVSKNSKNEGIGFFFDVYLAHAVSKDVRSRASSGGFVTQLLCCLLESKKVDAGVVVSNHNDPLNPMAILTSSPDDIRNSKGSKYTVVPVNSVLRKLNNFSGKIVFVGLPCHIQSLRLWESFEPQIKDKIALTIGLFCHNNLEKDALLYLLKKAQINPEEVIELNFRSGKWPGVVMAKLNHKGWQSLHSLTIKDAFNYLSKVYCPHACLKCVDFCSELADISVGDPWLRGSDGEYRFKDGRSLVVVRAEKGRQYIKEAQRAGHIACENILTSLFEINFLPTARAKTRLALWRISRLKKKGQRYPVNHLKIPRFGFRENLRNEIGCFFRELIKIWPITTLYLQFAFSKYGKKFSLFKEKIKKKRFSAKNRHKCLESEIKCNL